MCRQGGYYDQAAYLARRHGETDLVVDILIEDAQQYSEALEFIWMQEPDIVSYCLFFFFNLLLIRTLCASSKVVAAFFLIYMLKKYSIITNRRTPVF